MKTFLEFNTGSDIGMERSVMPQIKSEDIPEFLNYIKERKITVKKDFLKISDLLPTQNKVDPEKILKKIENKSKIKPFLISSDNYILDSHHQLYALRYLEPKSIVPVYKIAMKMRDLLNIAKSFTKVSYKSL